MEKKVMDLATVLANCQAMCNYCFDSCLHEEDVKMMAKCIKLDKECAEVCSVTLSLLASNSSFTMDILQVCARICSECAQECKKHNNEHCQECTKVCEHCAEACKAYAA
ncbi:four-helix bundle copper-binding protein [Prevotella sp. 10(H)]|uniref:four-helix bundle copper-binding protein n=1 Tax=Prevotella sp. 10(H) TaxID=1158294 RepID=UPI000563B174|nr:four-helix bundle copper-binding protein [Prevotella sp. 10(H)]